MVLPTDQEISSPLAGQVIHPDFRPGGLIRLEPDDPEQPSLVNSRIQRPSYRAIPKDHGDLSRTGAACRTGSKLGKGRFAVAISITVKSSTHRHPHASAVLRPMPQNSHDPGRSICEIQRDCRGASEGAGEQRLAEEHRSKGSDHQGATMDIPERNQKIDSRQYNRATPQSACT